MKRTSHASDLVANYDFLRSLVAASDQACTNGLNSCWQNGTNPSVLPRSVVLPYPPNPFWNTSQRYSVSPIVSNAFWNDPQFPPATTGQFDFAPADASPNGLGSIKSARVYVPGLCSTEQLFHTPQNNGIYDTISDSFWAAFQNQVSSIFSTFNWSFSRNYSYLTTILDDGLMFVGTANTPRGGFLLDNWFEGSGNVGATGGSALTVDLAANYTYQFNLDDGFLTVEATRNCPGGQPTDCLLVSQQTAFTDFKNALELTLPQTLEQTAQTAQVQVLPVACTSGTGTPGAVPGAVATLASRGAVALGASPGEASSVLITVASGVNWTCVNGFVAAILRAKRINVYEDRVELVWFDGREPTNFAYGLYAAAIDINNNPTAPIPGTTIVPPTNLDKLLCTRPLPHIGPGDLGVIGQNPAFETRTITTVSRVGN